MKQTQSFSFKNQGNVKGGTFVYTVDEDTGAIDYAGKVTGKLGFISHDIDIPPGKFQADPKFLKSAALAKPGDQIVIGTATFTAIAITPGETKVKLDLSGGYLSNASATLDTSGEYFRVKQVLGHVKYSIFSTDVEADEIHPGMFGDNSDFPWWLPFAIPVLVVWANIKSLFSRK